MIDWFTTMRWGDPLFAGLAGSTARWDAWEPAAWQVQQAFALPEPMPMVALASAQQAYDATFGTAGRQALTPPWCRWVPSIVLPFVPACAQARPTTRSAEWCRYLPPALRVECEKSTLGQVAEEAFKGPPLVVYIIGIGLVLIGAAALIWGR